MRAKKRRDAGKRLRIWRRTLAGAAVILAAAVTVLTVYLYRQRTLTEKQIAGRSSPQSTQVPEDLTGTVEYNGKTYKRSSNVKAILCMGVDRQGSMEETVTHTMGGQADGIFVIAQDTARNTIRFLVVPRDTMTEITLTDLSGNVLGKDIQHLNLAYAYGDGREGSCQRVKEALSQALGGFEFDWYMAADTEVINLLNNRVGGVTVTIPSDGMEKKDPAFVKGAVVTLKGEQAEAFVRYRDIEEAHSAIYRLEREKEFIMGFLRAVQEQSKKDSGIVGELFEEIESYMVTDMRKEEYLKMAMDAAGSAGLEDGDFYTVPGRSVMGQVYNEFYMDKEGLTPILLELFYREV